MAGESDPSGWRAHQTTIGTVAGVVAAVAAVVAVFFSPLLDRDPEPDADPTTTTEEVAPPGSTVADDGDGPSSTPTMPASASGVIAYASRGSRESPAFVLDIAEDRTTPVWGGRRAVDPSVTADGGTVAAIVQDGGAVIAVGSPTDDRPRTFVVDGTPSQPEISPDGATVAFVTDAGGDDDIALLDVEAGTTQLLTDGSSDETDPSWSRDGSRLVYGRAGSADDEIVVRPIDGPASGGATLRVTGAVRSPRFVGDGEMIAYVGDVAGNREVLVRPLAGGDPVNASRSPEEERRVVVLDDGRLVTSAPTRGLLLVDLAGDAPPVALTSSNGDEV